MSRTPEQITNVIESGEVALDLIRSVDIRVNDRTHVPASLAELGSIVRAFQMALAELHAENQDLKRQLQNAVDLKAARKQLRYEQSVYWKYDVAGQRVDGPYCPTCFEEGHMRRLKAGGISGIHQCVHHKTLFHTEPAGAASRTAGT